MTDDYGKLTLEADSQMTDDYGKLTLKADSLTKQLHTKLDAIPLDERVRVLNRLLFEVDTAKEKVMV